MANSITYEVITSSTPVRNRPNHNAKILGYLYQGNTLEVISINNQWAYFKFNKKNAYIDISDIQLVEQVPITGNLTIEYIDAESQLEIQASKTYTNLELKSYTYTATEINGYKVYGDTTKTITLTSDNPNQTITFYYEEILGSINIKYIDSKTSQEISTSETYDNLPLLSYTYTAKDITYYEIIDPKSKSVILTETDSNQTINFSYKKIVGDVIIKYVDSSTGESILDDKVYNNLSFGSYTYSPISIDNYEIVEDNAKSITLNESEPSQIITFYYKKMIGSITIKYINKYIMTDISNSIVFDNLALGEYSYNAKVIDGYTLIGENTKTVNLTDTNPIQTVVFEYKVAEEVNIDEHPYIATRYVTPTWDINDDVILNFYITDWNQSDVVDEKMDIQFKVEVRINDVSKVYTKFIGENSINLGKLNEGEYELILQATDEFGRKSHELYNEFRIIDKIKYDNDILNNTYIITDDELLAYNISRDNNIDNAHNSKVGIQNLINDLAQSGVRKAILPFGTYRILPEYKWSPGNEIQYVKDPISIPSNFILDLNNSTIKQDTTPYEQQKALLFSFDHAYDSHIVNGVIEGDYGDRDLTPLSNGNPAGEGLACGAIAGKSKYCSFDNLAIKKFCGYAMFTGLSSYGTHSITQSISNWSLGDIDSTGNLDSSIKGKYTSDFIDLAKFKDVNIIRSGRYLGYLFNPDGNSWIVKYNFYDSSKSLISTVIGHQYRDVRKPNNASYLRCTYLTSDLSSLSGVMIMYYYFPRNCEFKNITFEDTRTCALAPFQGNNILIDTCSFARCATNITPVAIDFEDGWHNMQDYCMQNCTVLEQVGTGDLVIVGGLDLIFRHNSNFRITSSGCSRGQYFYENNISRAQLGLTTHLKSAFTVFKNNTIFGYVGNGSGNMTEGKWVIDSCIFEKIAIQNYNEKIIVRDCIFNWNYKVPVYDSPVIGGKFLRCTFNDFNASNIHISAIELNNCNINNMNMYLQGNFILNNCIINQCTLKNYTVDINIDLSNNCIINDFTFSKTSWANCNIIFKSIGSTFNNTTVKSIITDSFYTFTNAKTFNVITSNNTYLNDTVLATSKVLSNTNINFTDAK